MTSGFDYGPDGDSVVAKLSVDVPSDAVQSLRELTTHTQNFKVELEAANRLGKDFIQYLNQLPAIQAQVTQAQKSLVTELERTMNAQRQMSNGGPSMGVLGTTLNPWVAGAAGMGTRAPSFSDVASYANQYDTRILDITNGGRRPGNVISNESNDASLLEAESRKSQRDNANAEQQLKEPPAEHNPKDTDPLSAMKPKLNQVSNLANSMFNEMRSGGGSGSPAGIMNLLAQGFGALGKMNAGSAAAGAAGGVAGTSPAVAPGAPASGDSGGGMGGLGSILSLGKLIPGPIGMIAAALGIGATGMGLFQKGGEVVEGYRKMGQERGGGWAEGAGYEAQIRMTALNPFITTEQSRQIVQGALSQGFQPGKEMDSVTQFVAQNLKDMNMEIGTSFQLLKKNVLEGGMSKDDLKGDLREIEKLSGMSGYRNSTDLQKSYTSTSQALIEAGIPGDVAGKAALVAGQMWADNPTLAGQGDDVMQAAMSSDAIPIMAANAVGAKLEPGSLPETIMSQLPGGGVEAVNSLLRRYAQMAWRGSRGNIRQAGAYFSRLLKSAGFGNLKASHDQSAAQQMVRSLINGDPVADAQGREQTAAGTGGGGAGGGGGGGGGGDDVGTGPFTDNISGSVSRSYGSGVEVVNEDGQASSYDSNSASQRQAVASGGMRWRPGGSEGNGYPIPTGGGGGGMAQVDVRGTLQINVNPPEMQRTLGIPTQIPLTPTQIQAMQGYGNSQVNNQTPGERSGGS